MSCACNVVYVATHHYSKPHREHIHTNSSLSINFCDSVSILCGSRKIEKSTVIANKVEEEEEENKRTIFYNTTPLYYVSAQFFLHSSH